jgi:EAL domain-containing protein (putative c-di-GMP-specific phosphodiesterase class I)
MSGFSVKNFNLPWHQHDEYWISLYPKSGSFTPEVKACLEEAGMHKTTDEGMAIRTGRDWKSAWDKIHDGLKRLDALASVDVAFAPDAEGPAKRSEAECKAPVVIQLIAESMWLGDALLEDRVVCYLQPVVSGTDKIFGYESFARVKATDGSVIGGDKIIAASKVLGIEYMIDRLLHVQAIKTFVTSEFNGFLFVNFFPGFIHRPAVYLEGLSETAKGFGVIAKNIVLDFTNSETPRDLSHLKSVCDYARSRGYSIALDDIASIENARKLIPEIRPDFVKVDMHLVRKAAEPGKRETIRTIVEMTHDVAGTVIAEGVETQESYQALKGLGVDLFQGYLFSPPVPVEAALMRSTGTAAT